MGEKVKYLVRGATLKCDQGTNNRKLNLPESHGIFINDSPAIHKKDCKVEQNVTYFGICQCESPPEGEEDICIAVTIEEKGKEETVDVVGPGCVPDIVGQWRNTKEDAWIGEDKIEAVTMDSYLVCAHGGIIVPATSGQELKAKGK